ncbi:MAG: hypothetical protein AAGC95_18255, partial [Pseudomonadota bacterium]
MKPALQWFSSPALAGEVGRAGRAGRRGLCDFSGWKGGFGCAASVWPPPSAVADTSPAKAGE